MRVEGVNWLQQVGRVYRIGGVDPGSILPIGPVCSVASLLSVGSAGSLGSVLSALSRWSVLAWREKHHAGLADEEDGSVDEADHLVCAVLRRIKPSSAASSYVCPVDDAAESFIVGVVVPPDDVPADHAGLLLVAGVVGPVQCEVAQCRELRLYTV